MTWLVEEGSEKSKMKYWRQEDLGKKHVGEFMGMAIKRKEFWINQNIIIAHLRATTAE